MRSSMESSSSVTVSWAQALRAVAIAWPRYWSTENAVPAPVLGELLQHVELVVADVVVGEHDDGQQLERGHVLPVGGRVDGDALVELGEPLLHHVAP